MLLIPHRVPFLAYIANCPTPHRQYSIKHYVNIIICAFLALYNLIFLTHFKMFFLRLFAIKGTVLWCLFASINFQKRLRNFGPPWWGYLAVIWLAALVYRTNALWISFQNQLHQNFLYTHKIFFCKSILKFYTKIWICEHVTWLPLILPFAEKL